jgi:ribosomal protein L21E
MKRILGAAALLAAAAILLAQQKTVLGTVTKFQVDSLELGIQSDAGGAVLLKVGPETQVVQIPPGERDLSKAKPAKVTDLMLGDRIMVSFVDGLTDARRIVLIAADDIARRNEAERLDWQRRGISGSIAETNPEQIVVEIRTPKGAVRKTITVTSKTVVRRYAPDSVKFTEATPSSIEEMRKGDQVKFRGDPRAEDIVFGTFESHVGAVTAIHREAGDIEIEDMASKKTITVHLTADSRLRLMPDMRKMFAAMFSRGAHGTADSADHSEPSNPGDLAKIMDRLPVATIDDIKMGGAVIVSSTRSTAPDRVTAIMVLANADALLEMARMQAANDGRSTLDVLGSMHGGMMSGPGGLSLPGLIQ